jgi:hypothetical protein
VFDSSRASAEITSRATIAATISPRIVSPIVRDDGRCRMKSISRSTPRASQRNARSSSDWRRLAAVLDPARDRGDRVVHGRRRPLRPLQQVQHDRRVRMSPLRAAAHRRAHRPSARCRAPRS